MLVPLDEFSRVHVVLKKESNELAHPSGEHFFVLVLVILENDCSAVFYEDGLLVEAFVPVSWSSAPVLEPKVFFEVVVNNLFVLVLVKFGLILINLVGVIIENQRGCFNVRFLFFGVVFEVFIEAVVNQLFYLFFGDLFLFLLDILGLLLEFAWLGLRDFGDGIAAGGKSWIFMSGGHLGSV